MKGASDAAKTVKALGFRHEPGDKSGGRGQAPLLLWIVTAEDLDAEERGEPGQSELAEEEG